MSREQHTYTGTNELVKAERAAREAAAKHLREALTLQEQIKASAQREDRELFRDRIYRDVRADVTRYFIQMERLRRTTMATLGNLETMRLPAYQSPRNLRDGRKAELERWEARRARRSNA